MKKPKIIINNKMKSYGQMDTKTNVVEINRKKHKGDKNELADTLKHELLHVKHPKMHEKTVYKKTGTIGKAEQRKLLAKLKQKKENYKQGAFNGRLTKYKNSKSAPGSLISKLFNK